MINTGMSKFFMENSLLFNWGIMPPDERGTEYS